MIAAAHAVLIISQSPSTSLFCLTSADTGQITSRNQDGRTPDDNHPAMCRHVTEAGGWATGDQDMGAAADNHVGRADTDERIADTCRREPANQDGGRARGEN